MDKKSILQERIIELDRHITNLVLMLKQAEFSHEKAQIERDLEEFLKTRRLKAEQLQSMLN